MTAPNHIAGGIVITGIFCSLWNVNIFSNPVYITATVIGSLIPDIDHTKSLIGKAVYPLAKWLSVKFGHRTITHSLIFLIGITTTAYILEHFNFINFLDPNTPKVLHPISIILFFAVFSHILLDMVTIQGIPLFYPFYRNPCVLPANVELRIKTGNLKQEGIALFIFAFFTIFFQDLFKNGFWFTYNKNFNDITHLEREFKKSNVLMSIDYNFNLFQKNYKGDGYLVYADQNQCYILGDTLINLHNYRQGQIIHWLKPRKNKSNLTLLRSDFYNISLDSINKFLYKKFISTGKIFATQKVDIITKSGLINNLYFDLKNEYNLNIISNLKDSLNHQVNNDIRQVEYKIQIEKDAVNNSNRKYYRAKRQLKNLELQLSKIDKSKIYQINEIKNKIINLKRITTNFTFKTSKTLIKLQNQLKSLKNKPIHEQIHFTGQFNYFELPKQ